MTALREIVLDTETTGINPLTGDRVLEIGCVELCNHLPTGRTWHQYINPERDVPAEAAAVHGLTADFLKDKPVFVEVYTDFLDFIADSRLVIHNAPFDVGFLNAELRRVGHKGIDMAMVTDSLVLARKIFPGSPASLDALCKRFGIDNSGRDLHGALLDSQLLAEVYLELLGGRQRGLSLDVVTRSDLSGTAQEPAADRPFHPPRSFPLTPGEEAAHAALCARLQDPVWNKCA